MLGLEALTGVAMKSSVFWDTSRCGLMKVYRRFGGTLPPFSESKNKPNKKPESAGLIQA
jgi:hypothetical protein